MRDNQDCHFGAKELLSPIQKALVVGSGGTLSYYAILLALAWASSHFHSDAGLILMMVISVPLLPGAIPGGLLSLFLEAVGIRGFGFHDTGFGVSCLVSAPLVNSYLSWLWIKRKVDANSKAL